MVLFQNPYLMVFAVAFMGCVLTTPMVTRLAAWAGAIDRPDKIRRIHQGAIPRLGGVGLACGLGLAMVPILLGTALDHWPPAANWWSKQWAVVLAAVIVLIVGAIDDTRGMQPRAKLMGQAVAVLVLFSGGIRIKSIAILGYPIDLSHPIPLHVLGHGMSLDLISLAVSMVWFLGCMNVWNLIDGMDGLASGVGLLVSGTLMLVALRPGGGDMGAAVMAAALAGSLAGFLLYNWHPACIFLGDSGSLLIGLLIGVIGVGSSMKGTTTVSILFPILAMGLPISDTAMAIFRRWVRNLPLTSADRRHIHHMLIGLGLDPRLAAILLYCFSAFLCGVVLLGVAMSNPWQGDIIALLLGGSGCLAFLLILTSRRDELAMLRADLKARFARTRQEKAAAEATWEAIQQIELCDDPDRIWAILIGAARAVGCDGLELACDRQGREVLRRGEPGPGPSLSGSSAVFRLTGEDDLRLCLSAHQSEAAPLPADIAFRSVQRMALATAQRLGRLLAVPGPGPSANAFPSALPPAPAPAPAGGRDALGWLRWALGW